MRLEKGLSFFLGDPVLRRLLEGSGGLDKTVFAFINLFGSVAWWVEFGRLFRAL